MKVKFGQCKACRYAQRKPDSIIGKIWRWHTKWCPGWKAYQRELEQQGKS
jgi:hypothetical protein